VRFAEFDFSFNTGRDVIIRYVYIVLRVRNLDAGLDFYCNKLGLKQVRRVDDEKNKKPCL